jgi:acetyl-CoA acetyltransferase
MRDVVVRGVGMIPFGRHAELSYTDLALPAVVDALQDAEIDRPQIEAVYCGSSFGGMLIGQRILRTAGLTGGPVVNVENACSSGATALREAWIAIAAGMYDTVLVIGVDKLTQFDGGPIPLDRTDWEAANGMVMPAVYAMRANRYLHEQGLGPEALAGVSVKARANGAHNPYAQMRTPVTADQVLASRPVADPLTLLQCCPTGDGAAALVLSAASAAPAHRRHVRVLASVLHSGRFTAGPRDMAVAELTEISATEAYEMAGIGPDELDVVELHDAFTIAELMYYEALQLCGPGEAVKLLESGHTSLGGAQPVNPSGGLLARGHPIGATGAAQAVEMVWQLRGQCGPRQVAGARVGLTHATGGGLSGLDHGACTIHVFAA